MSGGEAGRMPETEVAICGGLFVMPVPGDWEPTPLGHAGCLFRLPDDSVLDVTVESRADPKAVAEDDYQAHLPGAAALGPGRIDRGTAEGRWWFAPIPVGEGQEGYQGFRLYRLELREPYILRLATAAHAFPATTDRDWLAARVDLVAQGLMAGRFSSGEHALDRVAATEQLTCVCYGGRIFLRLPRDWQFDPDADGKGAVFPPEGAGIPDFTFWIHAFAHHPTGDDIAMARRASESAAQQVEADALSIEDVEDGLFVRTDWQAEDDADRLWVRGWRRVVPTPDQVVVADFTFVITAADRAHPDADKLLEFFEKEIRRAVIDASLRPGDEPEAA